MLPPSSRKKLISWALAVALAVIATCYVRTRGLGGASRAAIRKEVMAGMTLHNHALLKPDGREIVLADIPGTLKLAYFWSSASSRWEDDVRELLKLRESHRAQGLEVLLINTDEAEEARRIEGSLKELGVDFQAYLDPQWRLRAEIGVQEVPTLVVIDGYRRVRQVYPGGPDWGSSDFRSRLARWMMPGMED